MLYIQAPQPTRFASNKVSAGVNEGDSTLPTSNICPSWQDFFYAAFYLFLAGGYSRWLAVGWVANLLAHALAISLKTTGCRVHQRVFLLNNNKGKGSSRSVKEWLLSCVIVTQISVVFGRLPPQTTKLVPAYFGHQKTCFLHNTSKCFLLLVIPSMPPVECSQQMLGYGGPSPRKF